MMRSHFADPPDTYAADIKQALDELRLLHLIPSV